MESQLDILSESLDQKLSVLQEIQEYNERQAQDFAEGRADLDSFDEAVEEKDRLIEKISKLDEGFELLYEKLAEELKDHRERYAVQIKALQDKISKVTEMSVSIQAQEARNKKLVEAYFANARRGLNQNRKNSKAAYDYYKSMSGTAGQHSHFMDSKQ